ncbi:MAG: precorrin-2 dehydrogenase/sirohydrochlorin ferrochelatase family protein [Caulobacteraceae bacterium]
MNVFPAFIPLTNRRVVIAGDDEAAQAKARLFDGSAATLVYLAGEAALDSAGYHGAALAFVAGPETFAKAAAAAARAAGVLVNVVDKPHLSDFQTPSIIDRGSVVGAIGTGGSAPVLASQLRSAIEAQWPNGLGAVADLLRLLQPEIRAALPDLDQRRAYLRRQLDGPAARAALDGRTDEAMALARLDLTQPTARQGVIWRLEAPESADLLTLRALRVLARVDRLVAPVRIDPDLLVLARRDALRFEPQDAPSTVLIAWAEAGLEVVFVVPAGRTSPEIDAAQRAGADICALA